MGAGGRKNSPPGLHGGMRNLSHGSDVAYTCAEDDYDSDIRIHRPINRYVVSNCGNHCLETASGGIPEKNMKQTEGQITLEEYLYQRPKRNFEDAVDAFAGIACIGGQ